MRHISHTFQKFSSTSFSEKRLLFVEPVEKMKTISEKIVAAKDAQETKNATADIHTLNEQERSDVLKQVEKKLEGMDKTQKELVRKNLQDLERDITKNQATTETAVQVAFTGSLLDTLRAQLPAAPASAPEAPGKTEKQGFVDGAIDTAAKIPESLPFIKDWTRNMSKEGKALTGAAITLGVGVGAYYLLKRLFGRAKDATAEGKQAAQESKGGFFKKLGIALGVGLLAFGGYHLYSMRKEIKKVKDEARAAAEKGKEAADAAKEKAKGAIENAKEAAAEAKESGAIEAQKLNIETQLITSGLFLMHGSESAELSKTPEGRQAVEGLLKNNAFRELPLDTISLAADNDANFSALVQQLKLTDQVQINALKFLCRVSQKNNLEIRKSFEPGKALKVADLFDELSSASKTIARLGNAVKGKNLLDIGAFPEVLREVFEEGEGEVADTTESAKIRICELNPSLKGKEVSFIAFCNAFRGSKLTDRVGDDRKADVPEFRKGIDGLRTWFEQDKHWQTYLTQFAHEDRFKDKLQLKLDINTAMQLYLLLSKIRKPDGSYPTPKETPAHVAFPLQLQVLRLLGKTDPDAGQKMKFYLFFQGAEKASEETLGWATGAELPPGAQELFVTSGRILLSGMTSKIDGIIQTAQNAGEEFLASERGIQILLGTAAIGIPSLLIHHRLFLKYPQMAVAFANAEGDAVKLAALGREYKLSSRAVEFLARKAKESRDAVARLKDVRKGLAQYILPEVLFDGYKGKGSLVPYAWRNAWERFTEGRSFRRRVGQQRRIDRRGRRGGASSSGTPEAGAADETLDATDEVADTVPFERADADPAPASTVKDDGGPLRQLDPEVAPEAETTPRLYDPENLANADDVAKEAQLAARADDLVKDKYFARLLTEAGKTPEEAAEFLKTFKEIDADTLIRIKESRGARKLLAGAVQTGKAEEVSHILNVANRAAKIRVAINAAGAVGDAFCVAMMFVDLAENHSKIDGTQNEQLKMIYRQADMLYYAEGASGAAGIMLYGVAMYTSMKAGAGIVTALGAPAGLVLLPLAAATYGARVTYQALERSAEYHTLDERDLVQYQPGKILQHINATDSTTRLNFSQTLAEWVPTDSWTSWGGEYNPEDANLGARHEGYRAYFALIARDVLPAASAFDLDMPLDKVKSLTPEQLQVALNAQQKNMNSRFVFDALGYIAYKTQRSFERVSPEMLKNAQLFAVHQYEKRCNDPEAATPVLKWSDDAAWRALEGEMAQEQKDIQTTINTQVIDLAADPEKFETSAPKILLESVKHELATYEMKILNTDYTGIADEWERAAARGLVVDEIWNVINVLVQDVKKGKTLTNGSIEAVLTNLRAVMDKDPDTHAIKAAASQYKEFYNQRGSNEHALTVDSLVNYFNQFRFSKPVSLGSRMEEALPVNNIPFHFSEKVKSHTPVVLKIPAGKTSGFVSFEKRTWMKEASQQTCTRYGDQSANMTVELKPGYYQFWYDESMPTERVATGPTQFSTSAPVAYTPMQTQTSSKPNKKADFEIIVQA